MNRAVDLVPLFVRQFELSKVMPGEFVALLSDTESRTEYVSAAAAAAATLGAQVVQINVPSMGRDSAGLARGMGSGVPALVKNSELRSAVLAALSRADLVVDLVSETIIHIPLREDLRRAGCRILTVVEPPDALERMFPTEEIRALVQATGREIASARTLRVTSPLGTDLTYELDETSPLMQYGYADEPGRWDHWPSAMATVYPIDGRAEGTVVLGIGDIVFPFKRYVESEVHMAVKDGYIRRIEGGMDAASIRGYLESWKDDEVFAVSHIGVGLHPRAVWEALDLYDKSSVLGMDARSYLGGFIFSTGPNRHAGREVEAHLDMPMRGCTIELDGKQLALDSMALGSVPR